MNNKVIKVKISKEHLSSLLKNVSLNISIQVKEKFYNSTVKEVPPPTIFFGSTPVRHNFFYSYFTSDKVKWDYNYKAMQEEAE